jgi:hypothetical protein
VTPAAEAESVTVVAAATVAALSKPSRACSTTAAEQLPAVTVCAPVSKTRWVGVPAVMVSNCVAAGERPGAEASTATVPATVPRK